MHFSSGSQQDLHYHGTLRLKKVESSQLHGLNSSLGLLHLTTPAHFKNCHHAFHLLAFPISNTAGFQSL